MPPPVQIELPLTPSLPDEARQSSVVGRATSQRKLRGRVYTPLAVAERMVGQLRWPLDGPGLLDPSCGEGVFLEAAMRRLVALDLGAGEARRILEEHVVGWDVDDVALAAARQRLGAVSEDLGLGGAVPPLVRRDALVDAGERFDAVVGNPPYLEAKRMPDALKEQVRRSCPTAATGAFDLYGAFIELAFRRLNPSGELCLIVPNRFLVVAYAAKLRKMLLEGAHVRVVDLSTAEVFPDAAVYPIVVQASLAGGDGYRAETWHSSADAVELPSEIVRQALGGMMPLPPAAPAGRRLIRRTLSGAPFRPLREIASTRWCVSFHKAGLRHEFVFPDRPADAVDPRPFLGGGRFQGNREVAPYRIEWAGWWIDYDLDRARAAGNPLPSPAVFALPKVVVCQNARRGRAALDRDGVVLKDTFLSVQCRTSEDIDRGWLEWIVLVVNSRLFHYVYEHLYGGTRKGGGYLHYLPRYLDPFPIPHPPPKAELLATHGALASAQGDPIASRRLAAQRLVERAWGVTDDERRVLADYSYPDP